MRSTPLLLLLALGSALPALSASAGRRHVAERDPTLEFLDPAPDEVLPADEASFELRIAPRGRAIKIWLDGEKLPRSTWKRSRARIAGTLSGLAPGLHVLRALQKAKLATGKVTLETEVTFEVAAPAGFETRGSVEQLFVTHAEPDLVLELHDRDGRVVATGASDAQGSLVFRDVPPRSGYRVATTSTPRAVSASAEVMSIGGSTPPQSFYDDQVLEPGYGYITTRDGTRLSVFVSLPGPPEDGPYPTLVNYSGYDPSQPGAPLDLGGIEPTFLCGEFPVICDAPNHPSGLIAGVLGFATVGVNLRGTACSGGAFDFFEPLQVLDGYDVIETVAAQSWVLHQHVGMVGISYPGISQLFVAAARPPSLASITPLSVISGTDTTLSPGGILNDGFAVEWGQQVLDRADPYGHGWEQERVDAGDTICEENQLLHSQKVDIIEKAYSFPFYVAELYDPINPRTFVDRIEVPVFTTGAWQDEQTGGHFPALWDRFTGSPLFRATGFNGAHADGYTPQILAEWKYFLDFTVTLERRPISPTLLALAPLLFDEIFGAPVGIPEDRFEGFASFEDALAAYRAEPPIRILFESGGAPDEPPGAPVAAFGMDFDAWPPPAVEPLRLYLHADGTLRELAPSEADSASTFLHDDAKGQETYVVNDAFEKALPDIAWLPWQADRQVVFATEPLGEDLVLVGPASADLWVRSDAEDADLEVMISEIRPDDGETYVTSGWLRASRRALSAESTALRPIQTHLEADAAPLPADAWVLARVEIYPFAHAFRAGSRLRLSVSTPGANKGRWKFDVLQLGEGVRHAVSHSVGHASSLLLPALPGAAVPTPLPPCPALRSQPCREHVPHVNALLD